MAEPRSARDGSWRVNAWAKQAVLLYFRVRGLETTEAGPFEYHDKLPLKHGYGAQGVRVVPPATVRYGAHLEPGVVLMPSYVNIGAWVGAGTMVDTWATVGSCAQIGADVHLAGGVGIGGVLEPRAGRAGRDRGRRVHRLAVHRGRGRPRRARRGARRRRRPHREHAGDRSRAAPSRSSIAAASPRGAIVVPGTRPAIVPGGRRTGCPAASSSATAPRPPTTRSRLNDLLRDAGSSMG